jgi:hypothetical protein
MKKATNRNGKGINRRREWKAAFCAHLARMGNVKLAAEAAGLSRATVYQHRDADKAFAATWDEAMKDAADVLEAEAFRRAVEGIVKQVTHKADIVTVPVDKNGNVVTADDPAFVRRVPLVERVYSDNVLLAMLRAKKPNEYRDNISLTNSGSPVVDEDVVLVLTAPPSPPAQKG